MGRFDERVVVSLILDVLPRFEWAALQYRQPVYLEITDPSDRLSPTQIMISSGSGGIASSKQACYLFSGFERPQRFTRLGTEQAPQLAPKVRELSG